MVAAIIVTFVSDCMNPLKLTKTEQGLAWLLFLVPLVAFVATFIFKKKILLCCMRN